MSGSNNEITNSAGPVSSTEPSMEEILASIRRILKDEQSGSPAETQAPEDEEILVLDSSMVVRHASPAAVAEPGVTHSGLVFEPPLEAPLDEAPHLTSEPSDADFPALENETFDLPASETQPDREPTVVLPETGSGGFEKEIYMSDDTQENLHTPHGIIGESASEAAASSIGSLIRSISSERSIAIGRPGLTLEDLVREELRPLLKSWLDSHLPSLVERIVRAEIQRVIERSGA